MRKIIILAITSVISILAFGQISLEKTYSGIVSKDPENEKFGYYKLYPINEHLDNSEVVGYALIDSRDISMKIFNLDYSLSSSITIPIPSGYTSFRIENISKYLYNNDDKVEYFILFSGSNTNKRINQILNEDGNILIQMNILSALDYFIADNKFMMKCAQYIHSDDYSETEYIEEIYSLGGKVPTEVPLLKSHSIEKPYPNPSKTIINIPYDIGSNTTVLNIYNSNGQIVETKKLDNYFNKIELNVSDYKSGVYIYKYNDIANSFIVR